MTWQDCDGSLVATLVCSSEKSFNLASKKTANLVLTNDAGQAVVYNFAVLLIDPVKAPSGWMTRVGQSNFGIFVIRNSGESDVCGT